MVIEERGGERGRAEWWGGKGGKGGKGGDVTEGCGMMREGVVIGGGRKGKEENKGEK